MTNIYLKYGKEPSAGGVKLHACPLVVNTISHTHHAPFSNSLALFPSSLCIVMWFSPLSLSKNKKSRIRAKEIAYYVNNFVVLFFLHFYTMRSHHFAQPSAFRFQPATIYRIDVRSSVTCPFASIIHCCPRKPFQACVCVSEFTIRFTVYSYDIQL